MLCLFSGIVFVRLHVDQLINMIAMLRIRADFQKCCSDYINDSYYCLKCTLWPNSFVAGAFSSELVFINYIMAFVTIALGNNLL